MLLSIAYFCFSPMFKSVTVFSYLFKMYNIRKNIWLLQIKYVPLQPENLFDLEFS